MQLVKLRVLATSALLALASGGARAADLSLKAPPPRPAVYSWSGLYLGVNVGYSWGDAKYDSVLTGVGAASHSEDINGVIGGVQAGYNQQFGAWVFGFESDLQLSGQKGSSRFPGVIPAITITTDEKLDWFGTSRTRVGYLVTPTVLLYGTGGVAYGRVKDDATVTLAGVGSFTASFKDVKAGWTAGAGVEATFGGAWSGKLEYLYIDLGDTVHSFGTIGLGVIGTETRRTTDNIVRAGVNYRWGG